MLLCDAHEEIVQHQRFIGLRYSTVPHVVTMFSTVPHVVTFFSTVPHVITLFIKVLHVVTLFSTVLFVVTFITVYLSLLGCPVLLFLRPNSTERHWDHVNCLQLFPQVSRPGCTRAPGSSALWDRLQVTWTKISN